MERTKPKSYRESNYSSKRKRLKKRGRPKSSKVSSSPSLSNDVIQNDNYGRLIWGKIPGSRTWPGIILSHETCGMTPPSEKHVWIFWFGDKRISLGQINKTYDFATCFNKYSLKHHSPATFCRGLFDILAECQKRVGLQLARDRSDLERLLKWAREGFESSSGQLFWPVEGDSAVPESVLKQIERIRCSQGSPAVNGGITGTNALDQFPTSSSSSESDSDSEERKQWRSKAMLIKKTKLGKAFLDDFCIACEKGGIGDAVAPHPMFQGGLCSSCKEEFDKNFGVFCGADGVNYFCAVCCSPGEVLVCDNENCDKVFCVGCVELLVAPSAVDRIKTTDPWLCFLCKEFDPDTHGLLVPRPDWVMKTVKLQELENNNEDFGFIPNEDIPDPEKFDKKPLRVVSLFDGIGTGYLVLEKLGLEIDQYFASEVNKDALNVSKVNFKSKITYLGDVEYFSDKEIEALCPIDLLIGGSPCNDLSCVNPNRKGLHDPTGTGVLFFHFFRFQKVIQRCNGPRHLFWFFENVSSMPKECKNRISLFLQQRPVLVDAKYFSPQKRARFYWGNIPDMYKPLPEAVMSQQHKFEDSVITECDRMATVEKLNCVTTNQNSLLLNRGLDFPVKMGGQPDIPWITEIEKVFGFPVHFTDVGNIGIRERQALLGRSWSVPVISHLLTSLTKYFALSPVRE